jgi:DNA-binding HxlR family transcriptional regulator
MAEMDSARVNDYCSFSKAIEHLGDRWSLPILGQLVVFGQPMGFNDFANGLPGHISRSVLADKLRKLEELGLISRGHGRYDPYRLTAVGNALAPTILSLRGWAEAWLPEDPALVERDPDVVLAWLAQRVDATRLLINSPSWRSRSATRPSAATGSCSSEDSSRRLPRGSPARPVAIRLRGGGDHGHPRAGPRPAQLGWRAGGWIGRGIRESRIGIAAPKLVRLARCGTSPA